MKQKEKLKSLAASAATELRSGARGEHSHMRALADFLNELVSRAVISKKLDTVFWGRIAARMGEEPEKMQEGVLLRWFAGIAGEMSLLVVGKQKQVPINHLLRTALLFCDAMEFEND